MGLDWLNQLSRSPSFFRKGRDFAKKSKKNLLFSMQVSLFPRKGEIWTVDLAGLRLGTLAWTGLTGSDSPFFFGEKEGLGWMVSG